MNTDEPRKVVGHTFISHEGSLGQVLTDIGHTLRDYLDTEDDAYELRCSDGTNYKITITVVEA